MLSAIYETTDLVGDGVDQVFDFLFDKIREKTPIANKRESLSDLLYPFFQQVAFDNELNVCL